MQLSTSASLPDSPLLGDAMVGAAPAATAAASYGSSPTPINFSDLMAAVPGPAPAPAPQTGTPITAPIPFSLANEAVQARPVSGLPGPAAPLPAPDRVVDFTLPVLVDEIQQGGTDGATTPRSDGFFQESKGVVRDGSSRSVRVRAMTEEPLVSEAAAAALYQPAVRAETVPLLKGFAGNATEAAQDGPGGSSEPSVARFAPEALFPPSPLVATSDPASSPPVLPAPAGDSVAPLVRASARPGESLPRRMPDASSPQPNAATPVGSVSAQRVPSEIPRDRSSFLQRGTTMLPFGQSEARAVSAQPLAQDSSLPMPRQGEAPTARVGEDSLPGPEAVASPPASFSRNDDEAVSSFGPAPRASAPAFGNDDVTPLVSRHPATSDEIVSASLAPASKPVGGSVGFKAFDVGTTQPEFDADPIVTQAGAALASSPESAKPVTIAAGSARSEKITTAGLGANFAPSRGGDVVPQKRGRDVASTNFLNAQSELDKGTQADVGTDVAKVSDVMSRASTNRPSPFAESSAPAFSASVGSSGDVPAVAQGLVVRPAVAAETLAAAHRAVDAVLAAADRFTPASGSVVNLRLEVGDQDLAVRVEIRGGAVHTTFRTDSPELRAALQHEWQAAAAHPQEQSLRLATPVFSAGDRPEGDPRSPFSGEHPGHARDQAARQTAGFFLPGGARGRAASSSAASGMPATAPTTHSASPHSVHLQAFA